MDFRAATTVRQRGLIIIPTDTIGTHTSTIIHTLGMHIHITPHLQVTGTPGIGPTTANIAIIVITAIKPERKGLKLVRRNPAFLSCPGTAKLVGFDS